MSDEIVTYEDDAPDCDCGDSLVRHLDDDGDWSCCSDCGCLAYTRPCPTPEIEVTS